MKVRAKEREFNVFEMFCRDNEAADSSPFDGWGVAKALNEAAERLGPDMYVRFVCPEDNATSQWSVLFNGDRYDYGLDGETKFEAYPKARTYDERTLRRTLPAELDELLLELNKLDFEL